MVYLDLSLDFKLDTVNVGCVLDTARKTVILVTIWWLLKWNAPRFEMNEDKSLRNHGLCSPLG
jgi:hypothetical protein